MVLHSAVHLFHDGEFNHALRDMIDITRRPAPLAVSRRAVDTLRWLLGPSPHWRRAMLRTNTPFDENMFKQKLPFEDVRS